MRPRSQLAAALALALAAPAFAAHHGRHRHHDHRPAPTAASPGAPQAPAPDPRPALAADLAAQADSLARALAVVSDKLAAADQVRLHRLAAAVRALHAQLAPGAGPDERMASARRRVAAHLLLDRDAAERGLLADEAARLHASQTRIADTAADLSGHALPAELLPPASGPIAHPFGPFEGQRSHALLAHRGLELQVDDGAPVVAPAAGIVRYAGPIRGLDRGVVIDAGDFWVVLGKLGELAVPAGTRVARGDRLGRAARDRVYLEVRLAAGPGGLPIDPAPLLAH